MTNNSPISTTKKESLDSDDQQFTNINKAKESVESDVLLIITVYAFFCFVDIGELLIITV
jgi:hypothetical protein